MDENKSQTRIQKLWHTCQGSLKCTFIFFTIIHVAMIIIAVMHLNDCPIDPDIPKYLLATGIIGVISKLLTLFRDFIIKYTKIGPIMSFIASVELIVCIVGSYHIYKEYKPDYSPASGVDYCNKTVYLFAFIYVTVTYALLLFIVVSIGCFVLAVFLLDRFVESNEPQIND